jgi:hypothetical protein
MNAGPAELTEKLTGEFAEAEAGAQTFTPSTRLAVPQAGKEPVVVSLLNKPIACGAAELELAGACVQ